VLLQFGCVVTGLALCGFASGVMCNTWYFVYYIEVSKLSVEPWMCLCFFVYAISGIGGGPLLWKETTDIEASVATGSSWPRAASSRSIPSVCRDTLSSFVQKSEAFCMA